MFSFDPIRSRLSAVMLALALSAGILAPHVALAQNAASEAAKQADHAALQQTAAGLKHIRAQLDKTKAAFDGIESQLTKPDLTDRALQAERANLDRPKVVVQNLVSRLGPWAASIKARLDKLGPTPKDGAAESPDVAQERAERSREYADVTEALKIGEALLVQADQLATRITERRRALFARTVFHQSSSLLSPALWSGAAQSLPHDIGAIRATAENWYASLQARAETGRITALLAALIAAFAIYLARGRIVPRLIARNGNIAEPTGLQRAIAAMVRVLASTLPALAAAYLVSAGLSGADLMPITIEPVIRRILGGIVFIAFARSLVDAAFAPDLPAWRIVEATNNTANRLHALVFRGATLFVIGRVLDALLESTGSAFQSTVAAKGVFAVLIALLIANTLQGMKASAECDEASFGPYVTKTSSLAGPARLVAWLIVLTIISAALAGYIAFASFLTRQAVLISIVGMSLAILLAFAEEGIDWAFGETGGATRALQGGVGINRRSLDQISVVTAGLVRVVLIIAAVLIVLAPWGIESTDMLSSVRAAFFGFKVGDVTISLSTVAVAIALFGLGLFVTRVIQRWLAARYLPLTNLDSGLRDSIRTGFGYLGFFIAASLGMAQLGLSLDKIAIVAGALSVGIGFGLQSIVNNFVSGLILLWERSIRVGDWVVVGDEQGFVRRINVRATEIETFDRASVIVPNANFVSGVVKNWLHNNNTGRVTITVGVSYACDPDEVAATLAECARAHPGILSDPEPTVIFINFGESSLDFELMCVVGDVQKRLSISSDLRFAIFRAFREKKIEIPFPQRDVNLRDIGRLEAALRHSPAQS